MGRPKGYKLTPLAKRLMKRNRLKKQQAKIEMKKIFYKGMPSANPKGRPRKYPRLTDEEELILKEKRQTRLEQRIERLENPVRNFNKHNLRYSSRKDGKAVVLAWIKPIGEEEVVQSLVVDANEVDNITLSMLHDEYCRNKKGV